jgi:acyl-[acyl-carrier-protein]-phospholipid O-acyltransferase / long-chain-fatty-acid--[acyl-carrier-protein] ligase
MSSASIQILHNERLPGTGCLIVPGRLASEHIHQFERLFAGRKITWLLEESASYEAGVRSHMEKSRSGAMFDATDLSPKSAGDQLKTYLEGNGVLIFVPGRSKARSGTANHIPTAHLKALCAFGLPLLPIAIDSPRSSCLVTERKAALPIATFAFGSLIPAGSASIAAYQKNLLEAYESAYSARPLFKSSLGMHLLRGLKRHGSSTRIIDGADDVEFDFAKILAAAIAFSKVIKLETDRPRVAIVLPPGKGGLIANLAVVFAGKIPVNLNFTSGHEAIKSCIRQADVDRFITADPFVRKISSFPWPANRDLIFIERVLPTLKKKITTWFFVTKLLPASVIGSVLGLKRCRDQDEAALLFTSGSSGEPKGVVLTHRNVLANICQFASRLDLAPHSSILGCLPLFHSFGCTVTLWYPVIEGVNLVTYPTPLETKRLSELIALHQVDVMLSTPTFLRGFMKRIEPTQLSSLKLVVTGAEKLPLSLATAFAEKFGIHPQEGYGLTETSPATNVNLPNLPPAPDSTVLPSSRVGTVGQLLPGLAIKITDPVTELEIPINQPGIIWFRGANVFTGYLDNPNKSAEVIKDGWFLTGDIGHVDEDGFLTIQGRISRFSKIAGEMVPHETVEAAINEVLHLDAETERRIAVVGVPDEQKGEALLLLSTLSGPAHEQECIDLRYKLLDAGIASLWCPKRIIPVAEIPVLASGKLDIKACETLAKRAR